MQTIAILRLLGLLGSWHGGHVAMYAAQLSNEKMIHFCQSHATGILQIIRLVPITLSRKVAQEIVVYPLAIIAVHSILLAVVPISEIVATTTVVKFEPKWVVW